MPWVDISQAAFTLGVSERTIRNWIKNGKLNARSINGRREVEIPDPDPDGGSHAYTDDDDDGSTSLDTQKRLEVALIECGRVKGTLASQERIMENLSANVQEVQTKLQKSEARVWKRTLLALFIAFLGVIAWAVTSQLSSSKLENVRDNHRDELTTKDKEFASTLEEKDKSNEQQVREIRDEYDKRMDTLIQNHQNSIADLNEKNRQREHELRETLTDEKEEAIAELNNQLDLLEDKLAEAEKENAVLKTQNENLETSLAEAKVRIKDLEDR